MGNQKLMATLREFVVEREWARFHTPANLAKGISIEAAELLECFQWSEDIDSNDLGHISQIKEELADVLTYCFLLADRLHSDPEQLILSKLKLTKAKYPVAKSRGKSAKYDQL